MLFLIDFLSLFNYRVNPQSSSYKYADEALRAVTLPLGPIGKFLFVRKPLPNDLLCDTYALERIFSNFSFYCSWLICISLGPSFSII